MLLRYRIGGRRQPIVRACSVSEVLLASPNIPLAAIHRFARIAEHHEPDKIILFGSYAWETAQRERCRFARHRRCKNAIDQAIRIKTAFKRLFSLDLIVRTPGKSSVA